MTDDKAQRDGLNNQRFQDKYVHASQEPWIQFYPGIGFKLLRANDPSGNRNEVIAGGFIYYPDNPKRVWSMDQIGKAIFYYQRELNERFMIVVT